MKVLTSAADLRQVEDVDSKYVSMHRHTAHPHIDRDGSIVNLGMLYAGQSSYGLFRIPAPKKGTLAR